MNHNIVMWSGGLDSTLLLCETALNNPDDMVTAVSVTNYGHSAKSMKEEAKARKTILKKLAPNIKYREINLNSNLPLNTTQAGAWLSAILPYMKKGDNLNFAYLSSDGYDFFGLKDGMENVFRAYMEMFGYSKDTNILFPFENKTKGWVIKKMKEYRLAKLCWYCGRPKKNGKRCGKCSKCLSFKRWSHYPESGELV